VTENNRWRKPSLFNVLLTIVVASLLSGLGVWQLQRAEEKKQMELDNDQRKHTSPLRLELPFKVDESMRFRPIRAEGKFINSKQFVLDNQILEHQVGYHVFTPLLLKDAETVLLVDRGWLPLQGSRDQLPDVTVDEAMREVLGTVYVPYGQAYSLGTVDNDGTEWPRLIQYLDFEQLQSRLGMQVLPMTLRMDTEQKDVFNAQWPLVATRSSKQLSYEVHIGYAVQWFALALTVLVLLLVLHSPWVKFKSST
jgi:surfeit locus 1 family protein